MPDPVTSSGPAAAQKPYDVVIVGAGIAGAIMAKELANAGKTVLLLEAGRATSIRPEGYASYVETFHTALAKVPNSPYPRNPNALDTSVLSLRKIEKGIPSTVGYPVYLGPLPFFSNYMRTLGGTTLHFLGTCIRMQPHDFEMKSRYRVGVDWPITYRHLMPYYEQAELEIGVSADPDQQVLEWPYQDEIPLFRKNYQFPMRQIPPTYLDRWLAKHIAGMRKVPIGDFPVEVQVAGTPAGRNGMPNPNYIDPRTKLPYRPNGAAYDHRTGQRCEGNSACVPICPVMAKYNALRSLYSLEPGRVGNLTIITQAVASKIELDRNRRRVTGITCKLYEDESSPLPCRTFVAKGKRYVIAAHAIESAKLLLASKAARSSRQVGKNLMDHHYFVTHGLAPAGTRLGVYRGPQITSEIPVRDGPFRRTVAAFRGDIRNGGWDFATQAPYSDVDRLVNGRGMYGTKLRERLRDDVQRQISFGYQVEQLPDASNRVEIRDEYKDQLGNHRPVITYDVLPYSRRGIRAAKDLTTAVLRHVGGRDLTGKHPTDAEKNGPGWIAIPPRKKGGEEEYITIDGSGHIMGTHRMGTARRNSVVDKDQRTWDHPNLFLVGCGNMPTVGTSNPTLTIAALAFKAVERIKQDLKRR